MESRGGRGCCAGEKPAAENQNISGFQRMKPVVHLLIQEPSIQTTTHQKLSNQVLR
jgi:hypothetical protein